MSDEALARRLIDDHVKAHKLSASARHSKPLMRLVLSSIAAGRRYAPDGTMLDDKGNRSIFDDVDE